MLDLVNRSCLITGGSKGIGLAIAVRFARAGATCTLVARHERPLRNAISILAESGQQDHRFLVGDVGDKGLWEQAIKMNPGIDILVNSAGQSQTSLLLRTPIQEVDDVIRANLLGTIYGTKFYLKEMTRARRGCIINISSVLATTGGAGSSVYAASKSGLHGFVKSVAKEASRFNVRINNILPGYIETEMTAAIRSSTKAETLPKPPVGRFGTAAEIADAAYYLATNDYVTGTDLIVDGGYAIR
ncbi:hypothetical protein TWF106_008869 [Orbilia oligospora]|uniref:Ketoreductase domain-containing protein n=1 Tax=Orbilia oligospora TaxID=2813651 RepID=A0A6G1LVL3_ORBOL|nr:hypothetical protein TWF191_001130 [Orbilia oligospora]KAF3215026.1 hypothetical protein TWF106_008869 [Orbilia oligospora]KAF3235797.1 hypothetical protein TWF192_000615 [Orbilia oligospora]